MRRSITSTPGGLGAVLVGVLLTAALSGCTTPSEDPVATAAPAATSAPETTTEPDETTPATEPTAAGGDTSDAFAERDAFLAAQQQPTDGSPLVARTPEQIAFIDAQREYVESQGGQLDATSESIALALTLDACETSILNGHEVDAALFQTHVGSSPLIAQIKENSPDVDPVFVERQLMSIAVFGTAYVCEADGPQWSAAWNEAYPG